MKRNQIILILILSAIVVVYGILTLQWVSMLIAIIFIAFVLVMSDILREVKAQREQFNSFNECISTDINCLKESVESIKYDICEIKQILDKMEKRNL